MLLACLNIEHVRFKIFTIKYTIVNELLVWYIFDESSRKAQISVTNWFNFKYMPDIYVIVLNMRIYSYATERNNNSRRLYIQYSKKNKRCYRHCLIQAWLFILIFYDFLDQHPAIQRRSRVHKKIIMVHGVCGFRTKGTQQTRRVTSPHCPLELGVLFVF